MDLEDKINEENRDSFMRIIAPTALVFAIWAAVSVLTKDKTPEQNTQTGAKAPIVEEQKELKNVPYSIHNPNQLFTQVKQFSQEYLDNNEWKALRHSEPFTTKYGPMFIQYGYDPTGKSPDPQDPVALRRFSEPAFYFRAPRNFVPDKSVKIKGGFIHHEDLGLKVFYNGDNDKPDLYFIENLAGKRRMRYFGINKRTMQLTEMAIVPK